MKNKSVQEIGACLGIHSDSKELVLGFTIDSRQVKKGDLFFALPGKKVDGHSFLADVAGRGAVAAVVLESYEGESYGLSLLRVPDVREALHHLAKQVVQSRKELIIAITGSMGKTTCKEFLSGLLSMRYRVAKTEGSFNSQATFPLFFLNLEGEYDLFVLEMGMTEKGEIARLVDIAPPDIALITVIAPAHVGLFAQGIHGIAEAKAEIFSHPKTRLGFVSHQAMQYKEIATTGTFPKIQYGIFPESDCDFLMKTVQNGIMIEEKGKPSSPLLEPPFTASQLRFNLLAAIAVARKLDLSWEEIAAGCRLIKPFSRRFEILDRNGITFVNDSYNANYLSVKAALNNLPSVAGRKIGVLGTMVDQGTQSDELHADVAQFGLSRIDHLLCIGKECLPMVEVFQLAGKPVEYFEEKSQLKERLFGLVKTGDLVLIKGSNFLKLWELLEQ